jgi:hypothetical protein
MTDSPKITTFVVRAPYSSVCAAKLDHIPRGQMGDGDIVQDGVSGVRQPTSMDVS